MLFRYKLFYIFYSSTSTGRGPAAKQLMRGGGGMHRKRSRGPARGACSGHLSAARSESDGGDNSTRG